jgi:hypothetical protein
VLVLLLVLRPRNPINAHLSRDRFWMMIPRTTTKEEYESDSPVATARSPRRAVLRPRFACPLPQIRRHSEESLQPAGSDAGVDDGRAAGQTVPYAHVRIFQVRSKSHACIAPRSGTRNSLRMGRQMKMQITERLLHCRRGRVASGLAQVRSHLPFQSVLLIRRQTSAPIREGEQPTDKKTD